MGRFQVLQTWLASTAAPDPTKPSLSRVTNDERYMFANANRRMVLPPRRRWANYQRREVLVGAGAADRSHRQVLLLGA